MNLGFRAAMPYRPPTASGSILAQPRQCPAHRVDHLFDCSCLINSTFFVRVPRAPRVPAPLTAGLATGNVFQSPAP